MVKALARTHRWKRLPRERALFLLSEMAKAEKIGRGFRGNVLRLTLLALDIVEAILDGRQPSHLELPALLQSVPSM
ncbi:hypothetical protein GCM10011504_49500 [Siccirubricoccus deserti]|nr:hypothetical protein GCM10011504_49500 [Siccirubricoccus deserti]